MSENGDASIKPASTERTDVCRDFLKNICNRGNRCKFYHPSDAPVQSEKDLDIHFCIDFQNRGCHRENCRFVHVPREEAERYKATKEVTISMARAIAAVTTGDTINGIPVCKEFQTGKCSRGANRCRYWHVNIDEERERRRRGLPPMGAGPMPMMGGGGMGGGRGGGGGRNGGPPPMGFSPQGGFSSFPQRRPFPDMESPFETKRPRYGIEDMRIADLEKHNAELMKEVESLKREVQREHERYEDLYALFRQQTAAQAATVQAPPVQRSAPAPAPLYASSTPWGQPQWNS